MAKFLEVKIPENIGRKLGKKRLSFQSKSPVFLHTALLLLDFINKLKIGSAFLFFCKLLFQGSLILCLCPPGTGPRLRPPISSWSWPAAGTRLSARLTVWVPCERGPSSYLTDPITRRAALWVTPQTGTHNHPSHYFELFFPLRLGQTWRGWRTGCSSMWPECEISSSWRDWASTTTGCRWQRHSSSRRLYTEHNNRSNEWSHNNQRKPCWFCPSGLRPQTQPE